MEDALTTAKALLESTKELLASKDIKLAYELTDNSGLPILKDLELSVRASHCIESARIHTTAQLITWSAKDLKKLRSCGPTTIREIKRHLAASGLFLEGDSPC